MSISIAIGAHLGRGGAVALAEGVVVEPTAWLVTDNFTDTAGTLVTAHTSDSGHSWALHPVSTLTPVISDINRVRKGNTTATQCAYVTEVAPDADQEASCRVKVKSTGASNAGVCLRVDPVLNTMYHLRTNQTGGTVDLIKFDNNVTTVLDTVAQVFSDENNYDLRGVVVGDHLTGYLNGVLVVEATDAAIPGPGYVGLRWSGNIAGSDTTTHHVEDFSARRAAPGIALHANGLSATQARPASIHESVSNVTYAGAVASNGNIVIRGYDHDTGVATTYLLANESVDDHNVPSLRVLSGKRPVAVWSAHNADANVRIKVGTVDDVSSLVGATAANLAFSGNVSYHHLYRIPSLSDGSQDTYWIFARVSNAGWYVKQVSVAASDGAVTTAWTRSLVTGTDIYLSTAEADSGDTIRIATFRKPAGDASKNHYLEIDTVTGAVTSPAETLTVNLIANTGLPINGDTLTPIMAPTAVGGNRSVYAVRPGPDDPQFVYAEFTDGSPDDGIYYVFDVNTGRKANLGPAGPAFYTGVGSVYLGGLCFPNPSSDGTIYRASSDGTEDAVHLLTPSGIDYVATLVLAQPTATGRLTRPSCPQGGGGFAVIANTVSDYTSFTNFTGGLVAAPA